ncbi:hypothetical protein niasHS_015429 [Heterodera schachtii]|uniref:B30.2/SPRY domain-containing protein n=1 Tax=Heterodera schachtii TaxID=97005 RepID=A0ABD2HR33_HETSC
MNNSLKRKMAEGQSEENAGPIETVGDEQQQQQKEFHEKFAKMETELKEANQLCMIKDLEIRALQSELGKQNLMVENNALKAKIDTMEKEKEKQNEHERYVSTDQMKPILDRINELEKQQKEQSKATADQLDQLSKISEKINALEKQRENTTKATSDQFSQLQNDQKKILEKISEMDKGEKQKRKVFLIFRQNFWDVNACYKNLEIIGDKNLTVHYKRNCCDWSSVFAKHPILLNKDSSNIFYYEISIKNKKCLIIFGFTVKRQTKLDGINQYYEKGIYAFESDGEIWINGEGKGTNAKYSYCVGDTVGIGVHLITRQLFFTKNGKHLDSPDFFVAPSFTDDFFHPFVSLMNSGDKIVANFGPKFEFDLPTL